ncbi:MAG: hypothetical protein M9894_35390 [Planctomycetes bacterium]|nr:hypothetical protein [Planctomycetota bacterium]
MPRTALALLVVAAAVAGCVDPPSTPPAPDVALARSVEHYAGSAVAGPAAVDSGAVVALQDPDAALQVRVRWLGLEGLPAAGLEPIARRRRLLLDLDAVDVLSAVPTLSAGARAGGVEDVDAWLAALRSEAEARDLGEQRAALPVGVTAEAALHVERASGARARVAIRAHARAGALDLALLLERGAPSPRRELVVLAPAQGDRARLALILANPLGAPVALAAVVDIAPAPAPGEAGRVAHRAAHAACVADLARQEALALAAARRDPPPPRAGDDVGLARALEALRAPAHRRGALFAMGAHTGAGLVEAVALGGDDALVEAVSAAALDVAARPGAPTRGGDLGWLLERAAVEVVSGAAEADPPSRGAQALLVRRAGVVGFFPRTLREVCERAEGLAGWGAALEEANVAGLSDPTPMQRLLAAEWLSAAGRRVDDPLARPAQETAR